MAYYGNIFGGRTPEAPDIRQQRPGYFNQGQTDFSSEFAMPTQQGVPMKPFDPGANQWQNQVPDLWPEIQQELQGIMQQGKQPFYTTPEDGELTPQQQEHNKMMMAWKSPQGLAAIETGKYRELQQREAGIDRAEKRVATIEKQLLQAFKAEAPKGLIQQIEKRYNSSVAALDTMLKKGEGGAESGYPKFTGEGKMKLEGIEEQPGILSKIGDWLQGQKAPQVPGMPEGEFQTPEQLAQDPAEQAPQKSNLMLRGLLAMDQIMAKYLGSEKAKELTDQIVAGSKDPGQRLEQAIQALPPKAQKDPEVVQLQRQLTAQQVQLMPASSPLQQPGVEAPQQPQESMPITQRFMGGIPGQGKENLPPRRFTRGIPEPGGNQ